MNAPTEPPHYEASDAQPGVVAGLAGALVALVALGLVAGWLFLVPGRRAGAPAATPFRDGAKYRTSVEDSWAEYQRDTRAHLTGYGWVDRPNGVVRVPLERAIDLICLPTGAPEERP